MVTSPRVRDLPAPSVVDTGLLLEAVANRRNTRLDIAALYAVAIRVDFGQTNWKVVNNTIIERWSRSGLEWIKKRAWTAVETAVTT